MLYPPSTKFLAPAEHHTGSGTSQARGGPPGEHKHSGRVLVVEDEDDVADSLTFALRLRGLDCDSAGSGPEALIKASRMQPQLILLDLNLPGLDGLEICLRLKNEAQTEKTKIFILSARSSDRDLFLSKQVGADGHIAKPFELNKVVDKVCQELNMH